MDVKPVNGAAWRLEVSGLVADKRAWTLSDLQALPQTSMVIKHICVEGWSYIGGWNRRPAAPLPRTCRGGSPGEIRRLQDGRQLPEQYRHGVGAASARLCWHSSTAARRSPIRLDIRCVCARRSSSATRTRNGSTAIEVTTNIRADTGNHWAFHGSQGSERHGVAPPTCSSAVCSPAPARRTRKARHREACRLRLA